MKTLMRWTAVLILLLSAVAGAQTPSVVGQWQGTLNIQGKELRMVFVIATTGQGNTLGRDGVQHRSGSEEASRRRSRLQGGRRSASTSHLIGAHLRREAERRRQLDSAGRSPRGRARFR